MKKIYLFMLAIVAFSFHSFSQTYHSLSGGSFTQNWTNTGLITANDVWTGVPSIIGYRGDGLGGTATDPQTVLGEGTPVIDVNANQTQPSVFNTGGVTEFEITNPTIALAGSGTAAAPNIIIYVNATGATSIRVQYNLRDLDASVDNSVQPIALQYRIGTTGNFTNLPAAFVADASDGPNTATKETPIDIILPAECENQAQLQIRIIGNNAAGNDEWIGIDDIVVSANAGPDVTAPVVSSFSPVDNATDVSPSTPIAINFSENIQKGVGNILIKRSLDESVFQSIDVTSSIVTISGNKATIAQNAFLLGTGYYVTIEAGSFTDAAGNAYLGIADSSTWNFVTSSAILNASFNTCAGTIGDGFTAFSVTGAQVWACTTSGHDNSIAGPSTAFAPNAVTMNGFASGTNVSNEDWLISPAMNLTATNFPLLSYWSRTRFNGAPLQLKVSTNYSGTGNPNNATWTDLDGRFPAQTSNIWTKSSNINLSAFKSATTYVAFVYYSVQDVEGAQWSVDDIRLDNSSTPPPATLTTNTNDLQFGFVANGASTVKTFNFTANDITGDVTLNATGNFQISKTNGNFASSISYTQAEANNISFPVYVQFSPNTVNQNFTGTVTLGTTGVMNVIVNLKGNSIDSANTLEVVNWNVEWFGSTAEGPTNDAQQETNVRTILQSIGADVYALAEVVSEPRLANVVSQMPGYAYVISDYGSHTNTNDPQGGPLAAAQKLAFVYKTSVITPVGVPVPLVSQGSNTTADLSNPAFNYFASGRFPYMMTANVNLGGITKQVRFILIHAKANTSPTATSYARRKSGSDTLHQVLNSMYPNDNIMILGDFNDDLDSTITDGINPKTTSYIAFKNDNANFSAPTLALSLAGKKSTVSYNDMIDHVVLSNEMSSFYMGGTASVLTDVSSLVANYGSTTTDHYPVFTRYAFDPLILPVSLLSFEAAKQTSSVVLNWSTAQEVNSKHFVIERSNDGNTWTAIATINAAGNSSTTRNYTYTDLQPLNGINAYRLKQVDMDSRAVNSMVRSVLFSKKYEVKITPNPATDFIKVYIAKDNRVSSSVILTDINGKRIKQYSTTDQLVAIPATGLAKGTYLVTVITNGDTQTQKIIVQ